MTVMFMPESGRNRYYVYHLINTANELPFYVGYTSDLYGRYRTHLKKNPGTLEGAARFRLISALTDAGFGFELVVHHSFRYRGDAMRRESAMIKEMLQSGAAILNYQAKDIYQKLGKHLACLPRTKDLFK